LYIAQAVRGYRFIAVLPKITIYGYDPVLFFLSEGKEWINIWLLSKN